MLNAKRRLLFVITLSEWGGAQSYVLAMAKEALRRGYDVLVAAGGHKDLAMRCHEESIPYEELKKLKRNISPFAEISARFELKKLLMKWKPDVVFLHSSKAGVIGSIAARKAGIKRVVYRIGGWSFLDPVSALQKSIRRGAERHTAKLKDVIIVLHPNDDAAAKKYGIIPREQIAVIPNGIDVQQFDFNLVDPKLARQRLQTLWARGRAAGPEGFTYSPGTDDPPLVLTVANFFPAKNLLGYLDAIAIAHKKNPRVRFLILGDGDQRKAIESKRRKLGLDDVISLPGAARDASTLLRGADLFVLPSSKEGMSWALLEAMAAGLPCVATDVGANRWMLEKAGWIVPPGDAEALAQAIGIAVKNPADARDKGATARREVEWRFTGKRMMEETFRLL